ncbi:hypothetical protein FISHEDRAFT_62475 [Fistulina hepatica ATCC 64428]|nr:hypothetical protein FISHEDRAFT_62475 [Fistulina hepatica ATCC 64428]
MDAQDDICQDASLKEHLKKEHPDRRYICPEVGCGFASKHKAVIQRHSKKHAGIRPYCCYICGHTTAELPDDVRHRCNETFVNRRALITHNRKHHPRIHPCPQPDCGREFRYMWRLQQHHRLHSEEKRYCCSFPDCGFMSKWASGLAYHVRKVHTYDLLRRELASATAEQPEKKT